jgi:hypothetical protein
VDEELFSSLEGPHMSEQGHDKVLDMDFMNGILFFISFYFTFFFFSIIFPF